MSYYNRIAFKLIASSLAAAMLAGAASAQSRDSSTTALPQPADPIIAGIELRNPDNARAVLGEGIRYITDKDSLSLYTQFYNSTGHQLLTLFAGSTVKFKRSFKGYELTNSEKAFLTARRTLHKTKSFETGKGIHLGMSKSAVAKILGQPNSTSEENGNTVYKYSLSDASPFLQNYKATTYDAEYRFDHGTLQEAKVIFDQGTP